MPRWTSRFFMSLLMAPEVFSFTTLMTCSLAWNALPKSKTSITSLAIRRRTPATGVATPSRLDRGGTIVRSRTGYCNIKPLDFLAGKPIERELESHANAFASGAVEGSLEAPFFFTSPNVARVDLTMQIPSASIKFQKQKGKFQS